MTGRARCAGDAGRKRRDGLQRPAGAANTVSMRRRSGRQPPVDTFDTVRAVGLALPDVKSAVRYDGSPVLKVAGCFMAGLATHRSAEPKTLVVRVRFEEREWLLVDAPDTYYVTDYYRHYPVVLVRLSHIHRDALRDLLTVSRRLTLEKAPRRGAGRRGRTAATSVRAEFDVWRVRPR